MECCKQFARRSRRPDALDRGEPGVPARPPDCRHTIGTGETPLAPLTLSVQTIHTIRQQIRVTTILLLTLSNIFMTFAWYGHLKYRHAPLSKVIVLSWLIAFAEYCFQVPANRIGSYEFTTA